MSHKSVIEFAEARKIGPVERRIVEPGALRTPLGAVVGRRTWVEPGALRTPLGAVVGRRTWVEPGAGHTPAELAGRHKLVGPEPGRT
jgi:hypothetical protein